MRTAAIIGTGGYVGQETLDRVLAHPELELLALGSDTFAGEPAARLDPRLNGSVPPFVSNHEAAASDADVLFLCLSHADAAAFEPPADAVVVDLSGAHRLTDSALAQSWYDAAPGAWSYGLPELYPPQGRLIANPGCYATAALLALGPLADVTDGAVIDAKSGVSGAGKSLTASSHASRRARESLAVRGRRPPACAGDRAAARLRRLLRPASAAGAPRPARNVLRPDRRGRPRAARGRLCGLAGVRVLDEGVAPELSRVQGTDTAELGVFTDGATGTAIVICALDNLGKGAAGQAVQNANLALGLEPTAGLRLTGVLV